MLKNVRKQKYAGVFLTQAEFYFIEAFDVDNRCPGVARSTVTPSQKLYQKKTFKQPQKIYGILLWLGKSCVVSKL